jgi:hypothetical protein
MSKRHSEHHLADEQSPKRRKRESVSNARLEAYKSELYLACKHCDIDMLVAYKALSRNSIPFQKKCKNIDSDWGCSFKESCSYAHAREELMIFGAPRMLHIMNELKDWITSTHFEIFRDLIEPNHAKIEEDVDRELHRIRKETRIDENAQRALEMVAEFEETHDFKPIEYAFGKESSQEIKDAFIKVLEYGQMGYNAFAFATRNPTKMMDALIQVLKYEELGLKVFNYVFQEYNNEFEDISQERLIGVFFKCLEFEETGVKWFRAVFDKKNLATKTPIVFVRIVECDGFNSFVETMSK